MVNAARQVKAARPGTSVIAWLDSTNVYTGWVFPSNLSSCPHCSRDAAAHGELVNHTYNPVKKTISMNFGPCARPYLSF